MKRYLITCEETCPELIRSGENCHITCVSCKGTGVIRKEVDLDEALGKSKPYLSYDIKAGETKTFSPDYKIAIDEQLRISEKLLERYQEAIFTTKEPLKHIKADTLYRPKGCLCWLSSNKDMVKKTLKSFPEVTEWEIEIPGISTEKTYAEIMRPEIPPKPPKKKTRWEQIIDCLR